ncbi:sulfite exporter TauE/SafE family protein [Pseudodesulfovibrio cashew]|uniref:Sulfite exporter TauE/SafE family protein n=1 Tax=Pseudodesulfovibrio cashew TaxID=2678688 RepID=A0A6I6J9J9_9BACT|nr:sulfite exporter TauE/SafE family protein [Pseudodesulfovibrio cashew]QGY38701.1 sulfite exporter TauE/SafE family protein [Pseudodesulfovibrio cashew]
MDSLFLVALQSSLFLGLIHGINPCGHSWVVLAPFVAGDRSGARVFSLTAAFIAGTTAGCLAIGLALGTLSAGLPDSIRYVTDMITAAVIIALGAILIWRPHLLHSHDHDHAHEHDCECGGHAHEHGHDECRHDHGEHGCCGHHDHTHDHSHTPLSAKRSTVWGLATLGFVNMIVPCPTVAIMYSYALESGSALRAVSVFASYALGTGVALAGVIFAIYKVTGLIRDLSKPWIEPLVMRTAGVLTVGFGVYTLYLDFVPA